MESNDTVIQEELFLDLIEQCSNNLTPLPKLSSDAIEALYASAYGFYESGVYEKAMHFFKFLTLLDRTQPKYWMGLGASYQMLKRFEEALHVYGYAALLNENDPYTHYHAAECFFSLKLIAQGKEALQSAKTTARRNENSYQPLLGRIDLIEKSQPRIHKKKKIRT